MTAPLRLKRQKLPGKKQKQIIASLNQPIAVVLVDAPVSYLEGFYDYFVPVELDETAIVGSKVLVEFGAVNTQGIIIERKNTSESVKNTKAIIEMLSPPGLVAATTLQHINLVRNRFGGSSWNILKSVIPPRVAKEEVKTLTDELPKAVLAYESNFLKDIIGATDYSQIDSNEKIKWAVNTPTGIDVFRFLGEFIKVRSQHNQVLVLVPDEKDMSILKSLLDLDQSSQVVELGSHLSKSLRYRNYLKCNFESPRIILATRSGAFTKLEDFSTVIVLSDLDNSHYEQHAPGWNTRDVSFLRDASTSLIFISPSHSLEVGRLVESSWLESKKYKVKNSIKFFTSDSSTYTPIVKKGLISGNSLISVAQKGYGNLFLCAKCRNTAACDCGGKLQIAPITKIPQCYLCVKLFKDWKCSFCSESRPYVLSKGIDRTAEEVGRAIPRSSILVSSGEKQIDVLPTGHHIILATAGSEPRGNFSSVAMLDGEIIFNRPSLRSEEIAKHLWFSLLSKASEISEVYLSLANAHPVSQAIMRADSSYGLQAELLNRQQAKLPPFYRIAVVTGEKSDVSLFTSNLRGSSDYEITGPIPDAGHREKIIIRVDLAQASKLVELLDDVVKIQGIKGKKIFSIRWDPYDL